MIDHLALRVRDLAASRVIFEAALAPLGYALAYAGDDEVGFRDSAGADFWLVPGGGGPAHVAFRAARRADVDAFHAAALAAGAVDNGAPGIRAAYHPTYYAAFVTDLEGNNIEAVCRLA